MPRLRFSEVVECSHQDDKYPPTNLLSPGATNDKWLSDPVKFHFSLTATLRLTTPSIIEKVEIQNAGSSSIAIHVAQTEHSKKYSLLLPENHLRTEEDCRNRTNMSAFKTFTTRDFQSDTHPLAWSCVRLICYNIHRKSASEQFGLSFIHFHGEPGKHQTVGLEDSKFFVKNDASSPVKKVLLSNSSLMRSEKMMIASKAKFAPTSPVESKTSTVDDDVFDACVLSFLETHAPKNLSKGELISRWQESNSNTSMRHKQRFIRLLNESNNNTNTIPTGVLTPHDNNRPRYSLSPVLNKSMKDTTLSVLKPHLNDNSTALGRESSPLQVFRTEMSVAKPVKENGVYGDQSTKENQHPYMLPGKGATPDGGCTPEGARKPFKDGRKIWTGGRSEDDEDDEADVSPNQSFKRKSDVIERGFALSKKRLRDTRTNGWASARKVSPLRSDRAPSPPSRPESPLVDDIDAPSTSSKETVAERNIRLEIERRLAQRPPQDRVMRAPSGKVRGPYCTKGVTARTSPSEANSPLRRLSISEDTDEESRQARRKLNFPKNNGITNMVECPFCSGLYESSDIEQHASECSPSPRKQQPPEIDEEDDMMACPICMTFVGRDTVAAHADQCALKRYGA